METEQLFHPSRGLGSYKEVVTQQATIIPMFRNTDPVTSKIAGKSASKRSPSQQMIILRAFASGRGFTDEEVGDFTGLSEPPMLLLEALFRITHDGLYSAYRGFW